MPIYSYPRVFTSNAKRDTISQFVVINGDNNLREIMALFFIMNEEIQARRIQRIRLRDLANPFELPDQEFFHNYRMNKPMAFYLCRELDGELAPRQRHGVPAYIKVLVAIKFMAGGSYQREIGQDHNLCVAQRTVSKYLGQVVAAINRRVEMDEFRDVAIRDRNRPDPEPMPQAALYQAALNRRREIINTYFA